MALAVSYLISTVISFFLNKRFTFRNTYKKVHFQLASFIAVAAAGLAINEAIVYGLVHYALGSNASLSLMVARVIATFIVFVWNFMINKRITFRIFR
jgi:putative flippase GtrA